MRGLRLQETRRSRSLRAEPTSAEAKLWSKLRDRRLGEYKFVRQAPIGPYFADFLCRAAKLVIEVDGATHSTDEELARDARRTKLLNTYGYRVLRLQNEDIYHRLDAVLELILAELTAAPPYTLTPHAGRGSASEAERR